MKQLNIQDAGFVYQETAFTPMHICGMGIYDQGQSVRPRQSMPETMAYIMARIHNCPILTKKLFHVPGNWERPYWINDDGFDLKRHLFHHSLPQPGNEQQLHQLVSRLISAQLDMSIPLWECHIIEGLDAMPGMGRESYAILTKVHHSCIDGSSGNNVLTVLHDLAPDGQPVPAPVQLESHEKLPGRYEMMARAFAANIWNGYAQAVQVGKRAPAYAKIAAALYQGKIDSGARLTVPPTRFNKTPSTKRVYTSVDFSLEEIKAIKNVHDTTVNDVMVAIVSGALRQYLQELGELPEESLGAMLPKNIRDEKNMAAKDGNCVGGLITLLHTDIADPVERLKQVQSSARKAKAFAELAHTDLLFPHLMGGFLYPRAGKALTEWAQKHGIMEKIGPLLFNTVITNVAGPNFRLYHAGAPMAVFSGVPPLPDGIGLAHAIYSYCGRINLSVLSCPLMLEDADFYAQCLKDSFTELYQVSLLMTAQLTATREEAPVRKNIARSSASVVL